MCHIRSAFSNFVLSKTIISLPNGGTTVSPGFGDVGIFKDVLFIPDFNINLLSVSKLNEIGWTVCFTRDGHVIATDEEDNVNKIGEKKGRLFESTHSVIDKVMPPLVQDSDDSDSDSEFDDMPALDDHGGEIDDYEEEDIDRSLTVCLKNDLMKIWPYQFG